MENEKKNDLLSSWKEISSYLDCQERTCQRWEKQWGLPVHRIDDSSKSPVFAYKDELDVWFKTKFNNESSDQKD